MLALIWSIALLLAAVALGILTGLAGQRVWRAAAERRTAFRRQRIKVNVLAYLEDEVANDGVRATLGPAGAAALAPVIRELGAIVRGKSRNRLIALGRELGLVAHFVQALDHWRPADRAQAARDLQLFDEPRVVAALRARLADRSYLVRLAAARSLVRLGAIEDLAALIHRLTEPGGRAPPRTLGRLFRELAPTHGPELVALIRADVPVPIRAHALDALSVAKDIGAIAAIRALASDPAKEVRIAGLRTLERLAHPAAARAVRRALVDREPVVRAEAARCAGHLGLEAAVDDLGRLLEDQVWGVRKAGVEALGRLGEGGRAVLLRARAEGGAAADLARVVLGPVA